MYYNIFWSLALYNLVKCIISLSHTAYTVIYINIIECQVNLFGLQILCGNTS